MNNIELVASAKKLLNTPTHYAKGTFGNKATDGFINQKAKQYPSWYTDTRVKELKALDDCTLLMDCCGMIKYLLWDKKNGAPVYASNGVPDLDETTMFNRCVDKSTDFSRILPGEVVWMRGHIGLYVGDDMVIECTNAWTKDVLESTIVNGKSPRYRKWTKHGKLPYITYEENILFRVMTEHELVEVFEDYKPVDKLKRASVLEIVETKDNFGKTSDGTWVDLTKCRRITK